jgi:hypothetical protein
MIVEEASTVRTAARGHRLLMTAAIVVATAAGIVGAIMLVAPTSTGTYFAWALGPPGLAMRRAGRAYDSCSYLKDSWIFVR